LKISFNIWRLFEDKELRTYKGGSGRRVEKAAQLGTS
jgi:hypothetical protein